MAASRKKILGRKSFRVKRYTGEEKQYWEEFAVEIHPDTTVLDALNQIKDTLDSTLTFRWSCRMGICGSCCMTVNGKPVLTCQTRACDLGNEANEIRVEPLRNFPIIKDLVVDIDGPFEQMRSTMPFVSRIKQKALADGEYLQTPQQLKALEQISQCIKCMLCYSACPVYGNDKKFIGPAAAALAYRYNADSRDQAARERTSKI